MACLSTILRLAFAAAIAAVLAASDTRFASAQEQIDLSSIASSDKSTTFDEPTAAVEAFKAALAANDLAAVAKLVGLDAEKLKAGEDTASIFAQIREAAAKLVTVDELGDRRVLQLGEKLWPFPFPLVKDANGKWAFDTSAGLEEIVNRRIGENELEAIRTMREFVEAQREYASADWDGDGVLEYAQKLISSPDETDGLYWPAEQGDGESPAGNFANQAALEKAKKGEGYFGYRFRPLMAQGDNVAGGRYDYVINGDMIAGFALLAWPAKYGETGVTTFAVNQQGVVYQIDLGQSTESIVESIKRFNPSDDWSIAND